MTDLEAVNDGGDGFDVTVEQCDRTGYHVARCPLCGTEVRRATEHGTMSALCDHMNAQHPERRAGRT